MFVKCERVNVIRSEIRLLISINFCNYCRHDGLTGLKTGITSYCPSTHPSTHPSIISVPLENVPFFSSLSETCFLVSTDSRRHVNQDGVGPHQDGAEGQQGGVIVLSTSHDSSTATVFY